MAFLGGNGREIIPEADLRLIDRTMQPGDICKRSIDDVRSAVITKVRVEARVEHAVSGEPVDGWWTSEHLEHSGDPDVGEYVVMDDWIGQVRVSSPPPCASCSSPPDKDYRSKLLTISLYRFKLDLLFTDL